MSSTATAATPPRSPLHRVLGLIADVRPGEATVTLLLTLDLFLVLFGYYILKTIREALILTQAGAAGKAYTAAAQALLLLVLVPAFGAVASKVSRVTLITWVTLFLLLFPVAFFFMTRAGVHVGIAYFIWVGIFNTLGIAQFWAFVNDVFKKEQGKRLIPMVGVGASLGAWLGSVYSGHIVKAIGTSVPSLIGAGIMLLAVVVVKAVDGIQVRRGNRQEAVEAEKPLGKEGGFELIRKDRYLMLIAALIVILNVVNTTGEYVLSRLIEQQADQQFGMGEAAREAKEKFVGGFF